MTYDLKRGALFGVVAMLSMTACSKDGGSSKAGEQPLVKTGVPDLYGFNPRADPQDNETFDPQHYAVVYLKFGDSLGLLTARHAYFQGKEASTEDLKCAVDHLRTANGGTNAATTNCKPVVSSSEALPKCDAVSVHKNFDCFKFGEPMKIYAFIDNTNAGFNIKVPISFTAYGAKADFEKDPVALPKHPDKMNDNRSFFRAEVRPRVVEGQPVLYFENHFRDEGGKLISNSNEKNTEYSINFNINVCRDGRATCDLGDPEQTIPLVIDPGSGNGLGYPP